MKRNEDTKQPKEGGARKPRKYRASAAQFESSKTDFIEDDDEGSRYENNFGAEDRIRT